MRPVAPLIKFIVMSSITGKGQSSEESKFLTKYGAITILTTSTFAEWHEDCCLALSSADALGIVEGTVTRPAGPAKAIEKFDENMSKAKIILNGSIGRGYKATASRFSRTDDVKGLWEELNKLNHAKTPHYASSLQHQFHQVSFDPKTQKIQDVVHRLQRIQVQLQETDLQQTDEMIRQQLLQSLSADNFWRNQRMYVLGKKLSLKDAVVHLSSCESIVSTPTLAQASTA